MNYKKIFNFIVALIAVLVTLSFIISLYEYINVEILENKDSYIWGTEGPTAGTSYYENPTSYSKAMLHFTLTGFLTSALLWWGILKEKTSLVYVGISVFVLDIILSNLMY